MRRKIRQAYLVAFVSASVVGGGLAAPAVALASRDGFTSSSLTVVQNPASTATPRLILRNLTASTQYDSVGRKYTLLSLISQARGKGSGVYFLCDPVTGNVIDGFGHADEIMRTTVTKWEDVKFVVPAKGRVEIRFGDVNRPNSGVNVASVVVLR